VLFRSFALGALAYELLTGALPFGRRLLDINENQHNPPACPSSCNPNLPPELDTPILALLHPAPEKRPATSVAAVTAMESAWLSAEQRIWRKREVPRRLLFAAIGAAAAILTAGLGAGLRVGQMVEDRTVDARFAILPPRPPDPSLLIVAVDEDSLARDSRPLADWDTDFAQVINQLFSGGASAVAIDILLPGAWSLSREFGTAVTAHIDHLALAKLSTESGEVIGPESVGPLVAYAIGPDRLAGAFGFVNLDEGPDGGIRRTHTLFLDLSGREQPSFAALAVLAAGRNRPANRVTWIDYSTRPGDIPRLSWKDLAGRLRDSPGIFRNRLVIIGAEYAASNDEHHVPASASVNPVSGVRIEALIANTILNGSPVRGPGMPRCMLAMAVACFGTFALALCFPHRPALAFIAASASFCGYGILAFAIFRGWRIILVLTGPEMAIILSTAAAWILRMRLRPYPLLAKTE
jgi:CHASE2 domain-containing sensor protein